MNEYPNISSKLVKDSSLSFELERLGTHYGVTGIRQAAIWGKNPDAGKTAGDGEQTYIIGPRATQRGLEFRGRGSIETLNLLERACAGEQGIKNTVSSNSLSGAITHGYPIAISGIDQWIFEGARLAIKYEAGTFTYRMTIPKGVQDDALIATQKVDSVGEAISLYETNVKGNSFIKHIARGALIRHYLLWNADLSFKNVSFKNVNFKNVNFSEIKEILTPNMSEDFNRALEGLSPLHISEPIKEAMLTSMILSSLYEMEPSSRWK